MDDSGRLENHRPRVRAAETRLLYENANTGVAITVIVALLVAYAQWDVVAPASITIWLAFMIAVSAARFALAERYRRASATELTSRKWNSAFVVGTAAAAAGWVAGAIVLYQPSVPMNEVLVVFVVGGVMLGSASLLAARREAFLVFLVPTGLVTSLRVASQGDEEHLIMGFLGLVFTIATIITTWRFHLAIDSSLTLQFANQHLIESLQQAKNDTDALNRDLERRVRDRTAQLQEADQRKDQFLAMLAHELRNPLAPIRFALEILKGGTPHGAPANARAVIERQVGQLVRLVDDLLDVSRITADKIQLQRQPHNLSQLMTTAVESIAPLATAAGQTLEVRLPQPATWIDGDDARLVQVFANVLNNAVKFTPRDGHIWFTVDRQADVAILRIRDTGVGIAADVLPRVFDMFHQAEPALERSTGGLGIGLTLARALVEMHEGSIDIQSPGVGRGTEVEIRLPICAAPATTAIMTAEPPRVVASRRLRVLIVEDNIDAAEMLQQAVSLLGHIPSMVHDGATAIATASELAPDVIFLDIGLPVMNGYAVAQHVRTQPAGQLAHIAAVTGWGQEEDRHKAREAGCDSHFTKPLSGAMLEELLAQIAARPQKEARGVSLELPPRRAASAT